MTSTTSSTLRSKRPETQTQESLLGDEDYETDDYTSGAESTVTTRNASTSEAGEDEDEEDEGDEAGVHEQDETSDVKV